jgi:hypothetical protein
MMYVWVQIPSYHQTNWKVKLIGMGLRLENARYDSIVWGSTPQLSATNLVP